MKAVINERYGSPNVLAIREMPIPEPKAGEILVKVHATTVGRTDACALRAHPFFMRPYNGAAAAQARDPRTRFRRNGRGGRERRDEIHAGSTRLWTDTGRVRCPCRVRLRP